MTLRTSMVLYLSVVWLALTTCTRPEKMVVAGGGGAPTALMKPGAAGSGDGGGGSGSTSATVTARSP